MAKGAAKTLRSFRFVVLTPPGSLPPAAEAGADTAAAGGVPASVVDPELAVFGESAGMLARLADLLVDAFRETRRPQLPLVLAALHEPSRSYLVLGRPGSARAGDVRKNPFSLAFADAARRASAAVRADRFDAAVASVDADDLVAFVEALQNAL
ncbi:hypothetical protein HK405_015363 [Cladochytrium tenue]|nr:hypothetical protein HK405_015363 [Cladochytrium tenue]